MIRTIGDVKERKPFVLSPISRVLIDYIREQDVGRLITYDELSKQVGFDIQKHRGYLETARRRLILDYGVYTVVIRGEGIKVADEKTIPEFCEGYYQRGIRSIKKSKKYSSAVKLADLSPETQKEMIALRIKQNLVEYVDKYSDKRLVQKSIDYFGKKNVLPEPDELIEVANEI